MEDGELGAVEHDAPRSQASVEFDLVGCTDARVWAREFVRLVGEKPEIATDEDTMIGWFANAIVAGEDSATVREVVRSRVAFQLRMAQHDADRWRGNVVSWLGRRLPRRLRYLTTIGLMAEATTRPELDGWEVPGVTIEQLLPVVGRITGQTP
jgi:hypothetical protein